MIQSISVARLTSFRIFCIERLRPTNPVDVYKRQRQWIKGNFNTLFLKVGINNVHPHNGSHKCSNTLLTVNPDKAGNVQAIIGKVSFETEKLVENFKAFNDAIQKAKPATAKGTYITNLSITTTQGAGIKVDPNSL